MIDLESNKIIRGDIDERITKWETWFKTPWGYCKTSQEAVQMCNSQDINPTMAIVAVSVAVSATTHEVWER